MIQSEHITQVLEPEEGMMLTQADAAIALKDRVTSKKVYLGSKDSPDNWVEITVAEAEEIERRKKALADAREDAPKEAERGKEAGDGCE